MPVLAVGVDTLVGGGIAIFSAGLFALAAVLQQRAAFDVPKDEALGVGLVERLIKRPMWLAGMGADIAALLTQAAALAFASLLVVQPLLVLAVVFAIPFGAWWAHRQLGPSDYTWGAVLCVALVLFFVIGRPQPGLDRAPFFWSWFWVFVIVGPLLVVMIISARPLPKGPARTLILATVAGILFGVTGALLKGVVSGLDHILDVLTHWELYAFIVGISLGQFYQNASYESGNLEQALPSTTILKPLVGMVLGVAILNESLGAEGPMLIVVGIAIAAMIVSTVMLARSAAKSDPRVAQKTAPATGTA